MVHRQSNSLLQYIRKLAAVEMFRDVSDRELLDGFLEHHEENAFAGLMERHGSMVLGVCRRMLGNVHDAEDAFQATFLVLARKADSLRKKDSVSSWLHAVAFRVSSDLRKRLRRTETGVEHVLDTPGGDAFHDITWREVQAALDEELDRLPERLRAPLVLCCLEGLTRDEAAHRLRLSLGALRGRLERGRNLLRARLIRRGLSLSGALLGTSLAETTASASLPPALVLGTLKSVAQVASGKTALATGISSVVASLMEGVCRTMFLSNVKQASLVAFCGGLFCLCTLGTFHALRAGQGEFAQDEEKPAASRDTGQRPVEQARNAALKPKGQEATAGWTKAEFTVDPKKHCIFVSGRVPKQQAGLRVDLERGVTYTVAAAGEAFMSAQTGIDADPFPGIVLLYPTDEEDGYAVRYAVLKAGASVTFRSPWAIQPTDEVFLCAFFLSAFPEGNEFRGAYKLTVAKRAGDRGHSLPPIHLIPGIDLDPSTQPGGRR